SLNLTRIYNKMTTATEYPSFLTALCSICLLDLLCKYDCGVLGRMPRQSGVSTASLCKPVRNAG
ncbi:MAG: hypothetical protein ABIJ42_00715, partial [Acidobacteriota bacterium]